MDPNHVIHDGVGFLLPSKCATSSIKAAILRQQGRALPDPARVTGGVNKPGTFEGVSVDTIAESCSVRAGAIRDPFARFVSCWLNQAQHWPGMASVLDLLEHVEQTPDDDLDQHVRPQVRSFLDSTGRLVVTHWLRASILRLDWRQLEATVGWRRLGVPWMNRTIYEDGHTLRRFEQFRSRIEARYMPDVDMWHMALRWQWPR